MSTLAITGATGAIGSRLVRRALERGFEVIAVVRPGSSNIGRLSGLPVKIIECFAEDYENFKPNARADVFIHLAWEGALAAYRDDVRAQWENVGQTIGAVEFAREMNCSAFVFAGSQAEVGFTEEPIGPLTPPFPESAYGAAKLAAGQLSLLQCRKYGMRHCRARILSVFGEDDDESRIINYCVKTLLEGKKPSLTKCEQKWDFMYVDDAADAILAAAEKGRDGAVYSIGSGAERTLREHIEEIRDMIDPGLPLGFGEKEYYNHQPMRLCADTSNLTEDTGFSPDKKIRGGVYNLINHYKNKIYSIS